MSDKQIITQHHPAEHESFLPWSATALAPRAWHNSHSHSFSLDSPDWRFRLSPRVGPVDFIEENYDDSMWDKIAVPAHWALEGHGKPYYTNLEYPFIVNPPRVPTDNPTGDYRYSFTLPSTWPKGDQTIIRFDGVESWFKLWINNQQVGWSSGSRLPVEFDIAPFLHTDKANVVCVRVIQWSAGTYLEDQDQWWLPGIFRSVTILHRPSHGVKDHFVHATYDHSTGKGTLKVDCETRGSARVSVPELNIDIPAGESVSIPVTPWTAESPRLYDGELITDSETISLRIGFRTVEIKDNLLQVNGRPLLLRGINRHEFHTEKGRAVDKETMLQDVLMMKRHNFNAVRTAHYPPNPYFLDLCDEYGLWVVDEGDFETHGFGYVMWRNNPANSPNWTEAFINRTQRMVERDKNHPSIILWSLGNESHRGINIGHMASWIRSRDTSRPIHYENDWTAEHSDIWSHMYTWYEEVDRIGRYEEVFDGYGYQKGEVDEIEPGEVERLDKARREKPFLLIEYGHAMGNGPGGLKEYTELFEKYPRLQGGFIWEWIDHGLRQYDDKGRMFYAYGGDFGEARGTHGANFVCDGLLFPDRTPSPALLDVKRILQPVDITQEGQTLVVKNKYTFTDLSHLEWSYVVQDRGEILRQGTVEVPQVGAGETVTIDLPKDVAGIDTSRSLWCTVSAKHRGVNWADQGHEVAWTEFPLSPGTQVTVVKAIPPVVEEKTVRVGPAVFDSITGHLVSFGSFPVLDARLDLWRAPTDNDNGEEMGADWPKVRISNTSRWLDAGLDRVQTHVSEIYVQQDALVIESQVGCAILDRYLDVTTRFTDRAGKLDVEVGIIPRNDWSGLQLPRLGYLFAFDAPTLDNVEWFGLGPGEAYPDTRSGVRMGLYKSTIKEMETPYVMPQENGNRMNVEFAKIIDGKGSGIQVEGEPKVDFTVRRWSADQLHKAKRRTELEAGDTVWLNVDYMNSGVGSASTGPGVQEPYRLVLEKDKPIKLKFSLGVVGQ